MLPVPENGWPTIGSLPGSDPQRANMPGKQHIIFRNVAINEAIDQVESKPLPDGTAQHHPSEIFHVKWNYRVFH
jgi:hypothetical protein